MQGRAPSTLSRVKTPCPSLAPAVLFFSQQADRRTWHCLFTKMVKLNGWPSTRREVNQNSSKYNLSLRIKIAQD